MCLVLRKSMFEFIINDGQDSTSLNWRSLFPKIAYVRQKMYHIHIVAKNLKIFTQTVWTFAGPKKCVSYRNNIRVDLAVFPPRVKLVSHRGSQSESLNKQFEWVRNMTNKIRFNSIRYCDNLLSYTFQYTVLLSRLWPPERGGFPSVLS